MEFKALSNELIVPKSKLYDRVLSNVMSNIKNGSVMLLDQNGFSIAEMNSDPKNGESFFGSANRILDAGEKVLYELKQTNYNQIFESESYFLMVGPVNKDINYAILSLKNISLGTLRLHAQALIKDVKKIDNPE